MLESTNSGVVSRWMRLADALNILIAAGMPDEMAKSTICVAISDGAIAIRMQLDRHRGNDRKDHSIKSGADFEVPVPLEPQQLDFENSRPLQAWLIRRDKYPYLAGFWFFKWLEVNRSDLSALLALSGRPGSARKSSDVARRGRGQPQRDYVRRAIASLYPDGVPDRGCLPNGKLCKAVGDALRQKGWPASDDTILRAAGRRK